MEWSEYRNERRNETRDGGKKGHLSSAANAIFNRCIVCRDFSAYVQIYEVHACRNVNDSKLGSKSVFFSTHWEITRLRGILMYHVAYPIKKGYISQAYMTITLCKVWRTCPFSVRYSEAGARSSRIQRLDLFCYALLFALSSPLRPFLLPPAPLSYSTWKEV